MTDLDRRELLCYAHWWKLCLSGVNTGPIQKWVLRVIDELLPAPGLDEGAAIKDWAQVAESLAYDNTDGP